MGKSAEVTGVWWRLVRGGGEGRERCDVHLGSLLKLGMTFWFFLYIYFE